MKRIISTVAVSFLLFASTQALAAYDGYVTGSVYLRAGPDSSYPRVSRLRSGESVVIEGCVDDWSWCDVSARHDRGWLSADRIQYEYEGHRVRVPRYGVQIGIPILSFVFGSYWDDHYRHRSWYRDRDRYSRVTTRYYRSGDDSHRYSSRDSGHYQAPGPSRHGSVTSQPSYQPGPSTTVAPQRSTTHAPATIPERRLSERRAPVEHNAMREPVERSSAPSHSVEHRPAAAERPVVREQARAPVPSSHNAERGTMTTARVPAKAMPAQSKEPPAHRTGRDKGSEKGNEKNGHGGGKDTDNGGG